MKSPTVSVILPVFNADRFLREAIDSVLGQTFTDFELLVINDGSTDGSESLIRSYSDPRLLYLLNEGNRGLVFSLNRGLDAARGKYIARMDADDVCRPERFSRQVAFLESSAAAVVATTVDMMDEAGNQMPAWADDRACITAEAIQRYLPKDNCIAHPSIMGRASLLKQYKYDPSQIEAEDYDLWLRLSADGHLVAKIDEPLLRYRFLDMGLTRQQRMPASERLYRTQWRFFAAQWGKGKRTPFVMRVGCNAALNRMKMLARKIMGR
ncbi:MAG: glycosyltransferase [Flaviaesturariibacter sp.]|nr:glycosyltransferase [Flaviaesturariibacter sp.]